MGHSLEKLREFQIPELYKELVVQAGETEGEEVRIWDKDLLQGEEKERDRNGKNQEVFLGNVKYTVFLSPENFVINLHDFVKILKSEHVYRESFEEEGYT